MIIIGENFIPARIMHLAKAQQLLQVLKRIILRIVSFEVKHKLRIIFDESHPRPNHKNAFGVLDLLGELILHHEGAIPKEVKNL